MFDEAKKFHRIALPIFIIICLIFYAFNSNAYEVPKDAVIKVFTKDGKQIGEMSRKDYKVVEINSSNPSPILVKQVKITRVVKILQRVCEQKNRLTVSGDLDRDLGFGYSRNIYDDISLGFRTHTNNLTTIDLGIDF